MKILSKFLGAFKKVKRGKTSAVILCAGASTRFSANGKENKHFVNLILRKLFRWLHFVAKLLYYNYRPQGTAERILSERM